MTIHRFTVEVDVPEDDENHDDAEWWADAAAGGCKEYGATATYFLRPPGYSGIAAGVEVLGDGEIAESVGGHFTCDEAEAVEDLLKGLGYPQEAASWIHGHAVGDDDEGDRHRSAEIVNDKCSVCGLAPDSCPTQVTVRGH